MNIQLYKRAFFSPTKLFRFWNCRRKITDPCQQIVTVKNSFSASKDAHLYVSFLGFFSFGFDILITQLMDVWCRKKLENQNTKNLCNQTTTRKNNSNLESHWFNPQIHDILPLPLTRELTLKCKKEAREGLGPLWTLAVTWQMLCTQEALTLCWRILGHAHCLPLALKEGWGGSNRYLSR